MTRNVTMTIRKPNGTLWASAAVTFDLLTKLTTRSTNSIFQYQVSVTTDVNGQATAALETPDEGDGAWLWRCTPPDGNWFDFALEYGAGALDLSTIIADISLANIAPSAATALLAAYLPLSGGTLTGKLTLDGDPASDLHAATKQYVDDNAGGGAVDVTDLTTTTGNVAEMLNVAAGGGLQYRTLAQVLADLRDSGALATPDIGVIVQGYSAKTAAIAALTWAANSIILLTGTATANVQALAAHVVTFLQSASAADARTAIGAGTGSGDLLTANNLSELTATASTTRTNLGLGTLATQSGTFSGSGTLATGGFTLTVSATGTAALLAVGNTFTATQQVTVTSSSATGMTVTNSGAAADTVGIRGSGPTGMGVQGLTNSGVALEGFIQAASSTSAINTALRLASRASGTPGAGFGTQILVRLETSTTNDVDTGRLAVLWNTATHASRVPDGVFYLTDSAAEREIWRGRANGSAAAIGFLGATPVARAAHIADTAGDDATAVNAILVVLENLGFIATS